MEYKLEDLLKIVKEGSVLLQDTCDEVQISLNGDTKDINRHQEHWLVQDMSKEKVLLYNLDNQRTWRIDKNVFWGMFFGNKYYNIPPFFTLSNEEA